MTTRLLFLFSIILSSCSTDADVQGPFEEMPVIYSIIEPKQDFQYFRVQKLFAGYDNNALEYAQDPDNIYYDSGEIVLNLKVVDPEEPDRPYFDFPLLYYSCDTCKGEGTFFSGYQPYYYTYSFLPIDHESKTALDATLSFKNLISGDTASCTTGLIPCFDIINPDWECGYLLPQLPTFFFDSMELRFEGPPNGRVVNVLLDVVYFETPLSGTTIKEKTTEDQPMVLLNFEELRKDDGFEYFFTFAKEEFGDYLLEAVDTSNNDDVRYRFIEGGVATFYFEVFNDHYFEYYVIRNEINLEQVSLAYTNVKDGLGLMGAKFLREIPDVEIQIKDDQYWDDYPSLKHF